MSSPYLNKSEIAIAILAAGRGSRFQASQPKSLAIFRGKTLLTSAIDAAITSKVGQVMVVLGFKHQEVRQSIPIANVSILYNPHWQRGISSTLRCVIEALSPESSIKAVCIGLADQPLIGAGAYRALVTSYYQGSQFSVATYRGIRGNPVLLGRSMWDVVMRLEGDEGARILMRDYSVLEVPCEETGNPQDVDTIGDLEALQNFASFQENEER